MADEAKPGPFTLATLKPNAHSRPKRTRVGRGHGSGMVKTGGEGGKGQTVRSGGGKGPAFEGGQTPWASLPLPQRSRKRFCRRRATSAISCQTFVRGDQYRRSSAEWDVADRSLPAVAAGSTRGITKDLARTALKVLGGRRRAASCRPDSSLRDVMLLVDRAAKRLSQLPAPTSAKHV